jgi:hypothetical protein
MRERVMSGKPKCRLHRPRVYELSPNRLFDAEDLRQAPTISLGPISHFPDMEGVKVPALKTVPSGRGQADFVKFVRMALKCGYKLPKALLRELLQAEDHEEHAREYRVKTVTAAAIGTMFMHPEWSNEQIAAEIGCAPESLSRSEGLKRARRMIAREFGLTAAPRGSCSDDEAVPCWDEWTEVEERQERIIRHHRRMARGRQRTDYDGYGSLEGPCQRLGRIEKSKETRAEMEEERISDALRPH